MIRLIILGLAAAVRGESGFLPPDSPEVAEAKAAHLAAEVRAAANPFRPQGLLSVGIPVVTPDGFIADTPEVAAAKAAHFAFTAQALARDLSVQTAPEYLKAYSLPYNLKTAFIWTETYTGPIAIPVAAPQGYLTDTPQVASARAAHLRAYLATAREHFYE